MFLISKKIFFRKIFIIFDDDKIKESFAKKEYSSIVGITRNDLSIKNVRFGVKKTAVINLSLSEEEIFSRFSDTTRNEIRRTEKDGSPEIFLEDKNRDKVYAMYEEFEYSQGRVPFPENDVSECLIFSAYLDGKITSAIYVDMGTGSNAKDLRIRYIFSKRLNTEDKELYKAIGRSTRRLIWEICLWGKRKGFCSLDMATVNLTEKEKEGITRFKMSFGGEIVDEYTYSYKSKPFIYFEKLAVFRNIIKKLFH